MTTVLVFFLGLALLYCEDNLGCAYEASEAESVDENSIAITDEIIPFSLVKRSLNRLKFFVECVDGCCSDRFLREYRNWLTS
jgi:hypothetical protein